MVENKWESFAGCEGLYRLKTPEGWMVIYTNKSVAYVPDKNHTWKIEAHEGE